MARRKSVNIKWTLVLLLVVVSPYVHARPQESTSVKTDVSTENSIRYLIRNKSFSLSTLPKVISFVNITKNENNNKIDENLEVKITHNTSYSTREAKNINPFSTRYRNSNNKINSGPKVKIPQITLTDKPKPAIRKVITKWKDKTNYEDLTFNYDTTTSDEIEPTIVVQTEFNTDISKESTSNKQYYSPQAYDNYYRPNIQPAQNIQPVQNIQPSYSQGQVYSDAIQIVDYHTPRPTYILTNQPSPTPVITNVGYPSPWQTPQIYQKPTTQKPVFVTKPLNYNYHNSMHNYPGNFEVSTFPPTSAYTDRIVIRPQEYAGPDECPTIYLTLNNTFQGEGKEACPDLNIAVNTNVINKNVVVESEEEDDGLFQNPFGIPIDDSSTPDETAENEYSEEQEENQAESASVEENEFSNYQAAGNLVDESEEPISSAPSHHLSSLSKPGRPDKDDDDPFSFSSLVKFFKPALNALGWLVSINPFAIGLFPLFLTPIAFLFAGSGLASLFTPWFLPLGREAPKVVHVFRPYWHWDDKIKTWHLHSFPDNRKWTESRSSKEDKQSTFKPTLFFKLKELMKLTTKVLKDRDKSLKENERKRSKREIWTLRVKYVAGQNIAEKEVKPEPLSTTASVTETPREVKTKVPIRESIKLVANQLLDKPNITESPVVIDSRIPPKFKSQVKNKLKANKHDDSEDSSEKAHAGVAVPVTMEEIETEKSVPENESTTTNEGISTWILVSSPSYNSTVSTEPTKTEDPKKQKPQAPKNKNKKPSNKNAPKRPVIGSTNKADLIAGGSAINENVYNKIKDTVLTNVQKNKTPSTTKATTIKPTTTLTTTTEAITTTKKEETKAPAKTTTTKNKTKKKNKNKNKVKVTEESTVNDSAMLPMEAKEQEIELEVSTPPTTTKKPKRSSLRKKTKTKKRKTSKPKPEETAISEINTPANKTKAAKPAKKPQATAVTTSIYNYLSREVMPSVGVGVLGLASLVGIASYFFYPFATPVRRTFEVDKRDDLYKNNAEDYANEGNGQAEEEMLGTVLAGMPAHAKNKLNPYAGQTAYLNRYPVKNDQDIRYRQVATKYEPNYNVRYPQQKTGIAHAAVYSKPINYSPHYETRHTYTTEGKFNFDKLPTSYNYNYPTVEPIYAAPQTGPSSSGVSAYGNEGSNSVVYGVKPSSEADFKPVYPFETHFYSETTNSPATYAPTSMYLGSDNEAQTEEKVETSSLSAGDEDDDESKFVVGNVPKELADSETPAVVPEHGPRKLNRRRRSANKRRSISTSLEEILKNERDNNIFISNEIDDSYTIPIKNLAPVAENMQIKEELPMKTENVIPVYATSVDPKKDDITTIKNEVIESVSTIPINNNKEEKSTVDPTNESELTTKGFKVYEVFSSPDATSSPVENEATKESTTFRSIMTETTTEFKSETTSTMPSIDTKEPPTVTLKPTPIYPDVITYPPSNQPGSFFSFLKRLVDFKVRLGLSILQNTSESLNKFLKSIDTTTQSTTQRAAKAQKAKDN